MFISEVSRLYNVLDVIGKIGVIILITLVLIGAIIGCLYLIVQLLILLEDAINTLGFRRKHK